MKPLDYVTIACGVAIVIAISTTVYGSDAERITIHITGQSVEYLFDASHEDEVAVSGPIGKTVVVVADGGARVTSSPCDNQICVRTGHVVRSGRWIACLPNRVFVSIESGRRSKIDARSY